jgi:hypothetical protein
MLPLLQIYLIEAAKTPEHMKQERHQMVISGHSIMVKRH